MVYVIDEIMGSGKTSYAIKMIKEKKDEKYIYVTPYLSEVNRIKKECLFEEPVARYDKASGTVTKIGGIKKLVKEGKNVVTTHALFGNFDKELVEKIKAKKYVLIMDECIDVIAEYDRLNEGDKHILLDYLTVKSSDNFLVWNEGARYENSYYAPEMKLCRNRQLVLYGHNVVMKMFNVDVIKAFRHVYILTYMFNGQMLRYYLEYHKVKYQYKKIETKKYVQSYRELITICNDKRLNEIGEESLSFTWYNKNRKQIDVLRKNLNTYLRSKMKGKSGECMWTTFKDYQEQLKGYAGDFVALNKIATNEYKDRTKLAYMVNIYMNPYIKNFFSANVGEVDEDAYALSILVQWVWRSAIRDGKPICIYIPSKRMRNLFCSWLTCIF